MDKALIKNLGDALTHVSKAIEAVEKAGFHAGNLKQLEGNLLFRLIREER